MGRRPRIPDTPATGHMTVRMTPQGLAAIDTHRGTWSRSEYIRRALQAAIKSGLHGPSAASHD